MIPRLTDAVCRAGETASSGAVRSPPNCPRRACAFAWAAGWARQGGARIRFERHRLHGYASRPPSNCHVRQQQRWLPRKRLRGGTRRAGTGCYRI